ncbi:MAG: phosphatase PAP2-related protein [Candidatus Pacearchaeota archaeon]
MPTKKEKEFEEWKNKIRLKQLFPQWAEEIKKHYRLILVSLILLSVATGLDYVAGNYVTKVGSAESSDLILSYIPAINLNILFVYLFLIIVSLIFIYPLIFNVSKLHLAIGHFSLLIMVRSIFMSLTHLKTPATAIAVKFPDLLSNLVFQNDLFFSGHTAIPLIGFFLFKESKIRWFFLASSIILGATSLLMHRHYSIDVLAAFFIAYGTFKIGKRLFKKMENINECD